ncbi:hypothetical protein [Salinibacterium sp. ZJ77]|uniref:hypothetical protein n=1 Tax=Salinibacterium sp. ZJ77 TaxID=2708337 RepID=UPI001422C8F5|nr:hypothetical protein [Salinibacterium sp. ZJ77]
MRGIVTMALITDIFGWVVFAWLIVEDRHWQMPWFIAPLLIMGVVVSGVGTAILLLGRSAAAIMWGAGILAVSTLSGIAMLVVAWGETEGWAEAGAPALPLVISTHAVWIGTLLLIALGMLALIRFAPAIEAFMARFGESEKMKAFLARFGQSETVEEIIGTYFDEDILEFDLDDDDDQPSLVARSLAFDLWWLSPIWLPYSFLLFSAAGVVALMFAGIPTKQMTTELLLFATVTAPALLLLVSALAGVLVARMRRQPWVRGLLWGAAAPGRAWSGLWLSLAKLLLTHVAFAVGIIMLLAATGGVVALLVSNGVSGWVVLLVLAGALSITIGMVRWGNQYGGGVRGGVPIWGIALLVLTGVGIAGWGGALILILGAVVVPLALPYMTMITEWGIEFDAIWIGMLPLAAAAMLLVVVPTLVDQRAFVRIW